jgi:hypothetical protein
MGNTRASTAVPSGGATSTHRLPEAKRASATSVNPSLSTKKLVDEEAQASFLVADVDADKVQAQVGTGSVEPEGRGFRVAAEVRFVRQLDDAIGEPGTGKGKFLSHALFSS